jgi:hypothetical protein
MRLTEMYRAAVRAAMEVDPRKGREMDEELKRAKERCDKLEGAEKTRYDPDRLWNPYADSRILYGDPETEVEGVLWGIDITTGEALLADRLKEKGRRIDAVIGHHPRGRAQAALHQVMHVQESMMQCWGVPITAAECIMTPRIREVQCGLHASNHDQTVDACRLLELPFMCLHSPADLLAQQFMQRLLDQREPSRLRDLLSILAELPEYDIAIRESNPPEIFAGDSERRTGRIAVKFAGGTAAPKEMYEQLSRAGIGTVVCMHVPDSHIEEARKNHVSIVVASHMASDSLGTNLVADMFEKQGVNIIPCSGYLRVSRN